jgi:hypothetical protein
MPMLGQQHDGKPVPGVRNLPIPSIITSLMGFASLGHLRWLCVLPLCVVPHRINHIWLDWCNDLRLQRL